MKKNLVMGAAGGYDWDTLEPFVVSFKKNCPSAELLLFVDDISDFTRDQLIRGGCRLEDFPEKYKGILVVNSRFKIYYDFLDEHGDDYEQVLLTDTRDVIFQKDVFESFKDRKNFLGYATLDEDIRGSKTGCKVDYNNLVGRFGKEEADKLLDKKIICAGTIIGTTNEIKIFCRENWESIKNHLTINFDQVAMNYLVWNNLLPIKNLIEIDTDTGEIFTICFFYDNHPVNVRGDKILRGDGGVPAAVHQYTLIKPLVEFVDKIYRAKDFQFDERFIDTRSAIEQTVPLLRANKTGAATRLFLKKFLGKTDFNSCRGILIILWDISSRKPLSQTLELLELAIQDALKSVHAFSAKELSDMCSILKRAEQNGRPVDTGFKIYVSNFLLIMAERYIELNQPDRYFEFINLFKGLGVPPDEKFYRLAAEANKILNRRKIFEQEN